MSFLALPLCYPTCVAVEMTSHQNSPLPFDSIPAWISMALALPINIGILLSATEFCLGVPGAVNSKIIPSATFYTKIPIAP